MNAILTDQVRHALTAGRLAHLVTLEPDGRPQVTLVWVGLDGDQIVSGHMGEWRKVQNIRRDPRVALSIEAEGRSEQGLDHYLVVYGTRRGGPRRCRALAAAAGRGLSGPGSQVPPGRRSFAGQRGADHARSGSPGSAPGRGDPRPVRGTGARGVGTVPRVSRGRPGRLRQPGAR